MLKIPPATDCCAGGSEDITYILEGQLKLVKEAGKRTFATLNSKSAPITDRRSEGKMKAQYELPTFMVAKRSPDPRYAKAPIAVRILLLILWSTSPAKMLTRIPPMAIGSRWMATLREEKPRMFCMNSDNQNALTLKDRNPNSTTTLI